MFTTLHDLVNYPIKLNLFIALSLLIEHLYQIHNINIKNYHLSHSFIPTNSVINSSKSILPSLL